MPWLTIAITLLTYLLQPRGTPAERRKALLGAALAGGATYATTHYTDWGKVNLGQFDGVIPTDSLPIVDTGNASGGSTVGVKPGNVSPTSGLWNTLTSWGPTGTAAVVGTGAAALTGNTKWLLIGGAALLAIALLK